MLRPVVLACLFIASFPAAAQFARPAAEPGLMPEPPLPPTAMPRPAGVRKLSDASLTCEQIQAESQQLEKAIETHAAASEAAQREAQKAQDAMMKGAMGGGAMGAGMMAGSLLSMVPGGSLVSGMAAQAAAQAQMASMQESTRDMTAAYQKVAQLAEAGYTAQARNDHLIELFLKKGCKLPQ